MASPIKADDAVNKARAVHHVVRGKVAQQPYYNTPNAAEIRNNDGDIIINPVDAVVSQVPHNQPPANESSFIGNAVDTATNVAGTAGAVAGFSPMIVPAVSKLAGGTAWLANEFGATKIARGGERVKEGINNFADKKFSDVFRKAPFSKEIASASQNAVNAIGNGVNRFTEATGLNKVAPKYHDWRSGKHAARLQKMVSNSAALDEVKKKLPHNGYQAAREILDHAKLPVGQIDLAKLDAHSAAFAQGLSEATGKFSASERMAIKSVENIAKTAGKAAASHGNAASLKNMGVVVKELPKAIGSSKLLPGVANTAFIGMSALGMFNGVRDFAKNISALKEMSSAITGKKTSTLSVLLGDVPKEIAADRSKIMGNLAISEATSATSLVMSVLSAAKNRIGMIGFLIPDLVGRGAGYLIGDSVASTYTQMKKAHAAGQEIPVAAYAELIGNTSKDLKARGGISSPFTEEIAKQYAAEQISPSQVMKEAANGGVPRRINAIVAANEAAKHAEAASQHSHVAALNRPKTQQTQPVLGKHTEQLVANAGKANHALTPNGV